MADEIRATFGLSLANGSLKHNINTLVVQADMAGLHRHASTQDIGNAAHEALGMGADVATAGWFYAVNLDDTNTIQIGADVTGTFVPIVTLLAGESCLFRAATLSLYAKAAAGTPKLDYVMIEA